MALREGIYCTKEALDNEREAGERLGWTTGKIFAELADDDEQWFEPVDWQKLSDTTKSALLEKHKKLDKDLEKDKVDIREAIRKNDVVVLEIVKAELLRPVLAEKNCVLGISPNSLKNWKLPHDSSISVQEQKLLHKLIEMLQKPLEYTARDKRLCYPPSPDKEELWVRDEVEAPLILDLVAGDGCFSGPTGYVPYHERLYQHKEHYQKTDDAMGKQWKVNRDKLKQLRYIASKYLWNNLHGEWLPELFHRGDAFLDEFQRRLNTALKMSPFAKLLDMDSRSAIGIGGSAAAAFLCLAGQIYSIDVDPKVAFVGGALATGYAIEKYGPLAVSYQKARNIGAT